MVAPNGRQATTRNGRLGGGQSQEVHFQHIDVPWELLVGEAPQPRCPHRVKFNCDHVGTPARKGRAEHTGTGAYVNHEVAGVYTRSGDEVLSRLGAKEVLSETTASLVSRCPLADGHGA